MFTRKNQSLYGMPAQVYFNYMDTKIERRNFEQVSKEIEAVMTGETTILDLCCGTGNLAKYWFSRLENVSYIGVDINRTFLKFAKKMVSGRKNFQFVLADVTKISFPKKFDFVVGTSAYHHIKDERKQLFLRNAFKQVKEDGFLVIYEKLLPKFKNSAEAEHAGTIFYKERIADIRKEQRMNRMQEFALYNELYLTAVRKEEFKVPYKRLIRDLKATGFRLAKKTKLWPENGKFKDKKVGDWVIICRKE